MGDTHTTSHTIDSFSHFHTFFYPHTETNPKQQQQQQQEKEG